MAARAPRSPVRRALPRATPDRAATEKLIHGAVDNLLARDGFTALLTRLLTLEILAAEVAQRNELITILETERETWGQRASELLVGDRLFVRRPELQGLTILLIAGVQYLLVRSRKIRLFGGIDLRSDAGWAVLKKAARKMAIAVLRD